MQMQRFREASQEDLAAICRLGEAVNALHHEAWPQIFVGPGDPMRHAAHWQQGIGAANATTFVCERDGEVVGFVTVFQAHEANPLLQPVPYARIGAIGVDARCRGAGIGRALMERAQQWAVRRGLSDLRLHVWSFNARALRLYAQLGYEVRSQVLGKRLAGPHGGGVFDAGPWPHPARGVAATSAADVLPEQIESDRLVIRVARPGDGAMVNAAIVESLPALSPWLGWVTPPPSVEQSELSCCRAYARFLLNEDLMALFLLKSDGALVGGSGLHHANWQLRQFEVGYWGRTAYACRGLVTEGVRALAEHALSVLRASRVWLTTDERNVRSWRLAERAGFELEGTLRHERLDLAGRLRNTRVYARVAA